MRMGKMISRSSESMTPWYLKCFIANDSKNSDCKIHTGEKNP